MQLIAVLAALASGGGLLTGQMGWCFSCVLGWGIRQYGEFERFREWAKHPLKLPPDVSDAWYALALTPYRQLGRERQRTRATLARIREVIGVTEMIPDAVILLDEAGSIETMNSAARSLLTYQKGDIGLKTRSFAADFAAFLRSAEADAPLEFTSPLNPDQQLEARSFESETLRKLILVRDITSSNRVLTMRQQFVANVSHELRTPLTVVNGYLEAIEDPSVSDELRLQAVSKFATPMSRMQALVEDLLLLTQLEAATDISEPRLVSMSQVIQGAVEELQSLQSHPGQIIARCESEQQVMGSEKELRSVCTNLLSNALRHSGGSDKIEITWTDVKDNVRLTVADNGTGIPTEYLDRLTERFFRVDVSGAQARGGTGLGLAIVKHVLKQHDSELRIEHTQ